MPAMFTIEGYEVGLSRWTNLMYVKDLSTGQTFKVRRDVMAKFNELVDYMRDQSLPPQLNEFAIRYVSHRLVGATVNAGSLAESMFLAADPPRLLNELRLATGIEPDQPATHDPSALSTEEVALIATCERLQSTDGLSLYVRNGLPRGWAEPYSGKYMEMSAEQVLKFWGARWALIARADFTRSNQSATLLHLSGLFARAVTGHRREAEFVDAFDPVTIAIRMETYDRDLAAQRAKRT